jgi:sulfatase maturation enzyme AslB (radical SAM superfamily)
MFPNISSVSFWAAETLLNYKDVFESIKYFSNIKKDVSYVVSSNFAYDINFMDKFINDLNLLDKSLINKCKLNIQVSMEFPEYVHNAARVQKDGSKTFDIVYSNFKYFYREISKKLFKNIHIVIGTKGTYDIQNLRNIDPQKIIKDIHKYLDNDIDTIKYYDINNPMLEIYPGYFPDFIAPNRYISQIREFMNIYYTTMIEEFLFKLKMGKVTIENIWFYFDRVLRSFADNYIFKKITDVPITDTCSFCEIGAIDYNGNILTCHRCYTIKQYQDNVFGNIYENFIDENKINDITKEKQYIPNFFKDFKKMFSKHNEFNDDLLLTSYYKMMIVFMCPADAINKYGSIKKFNLAGLMNIYTPEVALIMKKFCDDYKDLLITIQKSLDIKKNIIQENIKETDDLINKIC